MLAAANCNDDLNLVPGLHLSLIKLAARHNLAVALDGQALASQIIVLDQLIQVEGLRKFSRTSIDG